MIFHINKHRPEIFVLIRTNFYEKLIVVQKNQIIEVRQYKIYSELTEYSVIIIVLC